MVSGNGGIVDFMKLVVANWKSNKNNGEVIDWLDGYQAKQTTNHNATVVICPAFTAVSTVWEKLKLFREKTPFLGVQDISSFPAGRYTGAISVKNLEGFDVKYAIVGHSERRRYFGESHQAVANKVVQCVENGITPIVCVDDEYIRQQSVAIESKYYSKCVVAYEELGAIGTGNNEPLDHVSKVIDLIRSSFDGASVLYGGSVDKDNIKGYLEITDGVLVGTASLDPDHFAQLVESC